MHDEKLREFLARDLTDAEVAFYTELARRIEGASHIDDPEAFGYAMLELLMAGGEWESSFGFDTTHIAGGRIDCEFLSAIMPSVFSDIGATRARFISAQYDRAPHILERAARIISAPSRSSP